MLASGRRCGHSRPHLHSASLARAALPFSRPNSSTARPAALTPPRCCILPAEALASAGTRPGLKIALFPHLVGFHHGIDEILHRAGQVLRAKQGFFSRHARPLAMWGVRELRAKQGSLAGKRGPCHVGEQGNIPRPHMPLCLHVELSWPTAALKATAARSLHPETVPARCGPKATPRAPTAASLPAAAARGSQDQRTFRVRCPGLAPRSPQRSHLQALSRSETDVLLGPPLPRLHTRRLPVRLQSSGAECAERSGKPWRAR